MDAIFNWSRLERVEAAIAWHREPENTPLAHVWHTDTIAELADGLRRLLELAEIDDRLITLLWNHVPGDDRIEIIKALEAPGTRYFEGANRLATIINEENGTR